jgi:HlyD family secretion protein
MDRIIEKKRWTVKKLIWSSIALAILILILYTFIFGDRSSKLNVRVDRISIEEVKKDYFQDYISFTGNVEPIRTVYLDAIEGGRVEEILIEEGSRIEKGDVILRLSNTDLYLNIMYREAEAAEQINNLRNTRLLMEQTKLDLKKQILELNYLLSQQKDMYESNKELFDKTFISNQEFKDSKDRYEYLLTKKELLVESQKQDSIFREIQIEQLEASVERMQDNLNLVRKKLDNLDVMAPVKGQLAYLNAEIGEAKSQGQRLGQINILDSYKINADIDEHYISRVNKNLQGEFEFTGKTFRLKVKKIYPEVRNGRFAIDMVFVGNPPENMRIGQTFRVKLELGTPKEALLLVRGGFYQSTGGQYVFVVDESGEFAIKRKIRLGRQNPKYYEVLEGLKSGDEVIISNYDNFGNADKLILKK